MKLYIADKTCSEAVQIIANELGIEPELVHFDVFGKSTSNGDDFAAVNPLLYVPVLALDNEDGDLLSETINIISYLADQNPGAGLIPAPGTMERVKFDQLLIFLATEIAQKHIPLMRKLMTEEGQLWTRAKIVAAYKTLDDKLATQQFIAGDTFSVADAYVWATWWSPRSGTEIGHLQNLNAWKARMDARASVVKAVAEEDAVANAHREKIAA